MPEMTRSMLVGLAAYLIGLGIVVAGGVFGAKALLATASTPTFLLPEKEWAPAIFEARAPIEATVHFKPYVVEASLQNPWKTSIAAAYTASAKPKEITAVTPNHAEKKKQLGKRPAKRTNEAMEAFAAGNSWQVPR